MSIESRTIDILSHDSQVTLEVDRSEVSIDIEFDRDLRDYFTDLTLSQSNGDILSDVWNWKQKRAANEKLGDHVFSRLKMGKR